jgi:hypothetical protein
MEGERVMFPAMVNGKRKYLVFDSAIDASVCDTAFAEQIGVVWEEEEVALVRNVVGGAKVEGRWGRCRMQAGGKDVMVKLLVVEGKAGWCLISPRDGMKFGIRVVGLPSFFEDEKQGLPDEKWLGEAGGEKALGEVRVEGESREKLLELVREAMEEN